MCSLCIVYSSVCPDGTTLGLVAVGGRQWRSWNRRTECRSYIQLTKSPSQGSLGLVECRDPGGACPLSRRESNRTNSPQKIARRRHSPQLYLQRTSSNHQPVAPLWDSSQLLLQRISPRPNHQPIARHRHSPRVPIPNLQLIARQRDSARVRLRRISPRQSNQPIV